MEAGHCLKTQTSANPELQNRSQCQTQLPQSQSQNIKNKSKPRNTKLTKIKMKAKAIITNHKDKTAYAETIIFERLPLN